MAQYSKRGRNNNRRRQGGNNNPNRSMDSQGPEVKIRGTAAQIYDKYQALARDASSSGDRIRGESLMQHAEHYYRLMKLMQPEKKDEKKETDQQSDAHAGGGTKPEEQGAKPSVDGDAKSGADDNQDQEAKAAGASDGETGDQDEQRPRRRRRRRRPEESDGENASSSPAQGTEQNESGSLEGAAAE